MSDLFLLLIYAGVFAFLFGVGALIADPRDDEENERQNWWAQQDQDDEFINQEDEKWT